jgi:tRNA A-37 threonylcarbamoyl transferase component Bud32
MHACSSRSDHQLPAQYPTADFPLILSIVSPPGLEQALKDLARIGTLIKDRGYRQVWRFEYGDRAYFLKFYPIGGWRDAGRRLTRGSPAMLEFLRLQRLQKADIPAPRAIAVLMGFRIQSRRGDAVVIEAIEPAVQLDALLNQCELNAEPIPNHLDLAKQIRLLIRQLAMANLGHKDLHLGNLLLHDGKLFLLDGYAVHDDGMRPRDLQLLANSVGRYATLTDLQRGWDELGPGGRMRNPVTSAFSHAWIDRITGNNRYFGQLTCEGWHGHFFKQDKNPRRWSRASQLKVDRKDWIAALPPLLTAIEADQLPVIKRSPSGDVLRGRVQLAGESVDIIIKRPRRRYWYRYINEIGRGPRGRRAWRKAWKLIVRNIPTAWPLLTLEKRKFGYVVDNLIIFECVPGRTLWQTDLDAICPPAREMLFRRIGRILRRVEQLGFSHFDAKSSNWIVRDDDKLGPSPVLIDVDGVRQRRWIALGIRRLLRSMQEHRQYTVADSLALCQGYAPYAPMQRESAPPTEVTSEETAT